MSVLTAPVERADTRSAVESVIAVDQIPVTSVRSFTLRTNDGQELVFAVGKLDIGGDASPANHLREHLALAEPIQVDYQTEGADRVANRLTDGLVRARWSVRDTLAGPQMCRDRARIVLTRCTYSRHYVVIVWTARGRP